MADKHPTAMVVEELLRRLERRHPGWAADIMDKLAGVVEDTEKAQALLADATHDVILDWGRRLQAISADVADELLR